MDNKKIREIQRQYKYQSMPGEAFEGFQQRQRRMPNTPKRTKWGVKLGDRFKAPSGDLYEVVELYGALCMENKTNPSRSLLEPLDMNDISFGYSHLRKHKIRTYEKVK